MEKQEQLTIRCDSDAKALEKMGPVHAYRIMQFVSGYAITSAARHTCILGPGDLSFMRPGESRFWSVSPNASIHYCAIRPEYFMNAPYIARQRRDHPILCGRPWLTSMAKERSADIGSLFRVICEEAASSFENKQEAISLHLQMMFLYIKRVTVKLGACKPVHLDLQLWKGIEELLDPLFDERTVFLHN